MIPSHDLRLGNWFSYTRRGSVWTTAYDKVESLHREGVNVYSTIDYDSSVIEADYGFDQIYPIPLTDEIIEATGVIGQLTRETLTHIKYVHQLQNLYFILTNKELEITF